MKELKLQAAVVEGLREEDGVDEDTLRTSQPLPPTYPHTLAHIPYT